jgi:hypothetical protein
MRIAGLMDGSLVDFIGEITEVEKTRLPGDAIALLFPIDWPEPFGITMIKAMACSTPVIGFRRGSVLGLSRKRCREVFEQRLQGAQVSQSYCEVYEPARQQPCPLMS